MNQKWMFAAAILMSSCVTKGKYEEVLSSVKSKEKQQVKLVKELDELRTKNQALKDSAFAMGGYDE